MPLSIIKADISTLKVDAIVNPTDSSFSGSGGTDMRIHRASGEKLDAHCAALEPIGPGSVCSTPGYDLPCRHIIHTVGPVWQGGLCGEDILLESCYKNALDEARSLNCESIALPIISAGSFGYPKDRALNIATKAIKNYLYAYEMTVFLVVYNKELFSLSKELQSEVQRYIYTASRPPLTSALPKTCKRDLFDFDCSCDAAPCAAPAESGAVFFQNSFPDVGSIYAAIDAKDESFSQAVLRKIDELGIKDSDCYKKANIDRRVFSKLRSNPSYKPSKQTALALAISLELDIDETGELLKKAGYALSRSSEFDIIVEYFIRRKQYDIFEINNVLYSFDQSLLGSV